MHASTLILNSHVVSTISVLFSPWMKHCANHPVTDEPPFQTTMNGKTLLGPPTCPIPNTFEKLFPAEPGRRSTAVRYSPSTTPSFFWFKIVSEPNWLYQVPLKLQGLDFTSGSQILMVLLTKGGEIDLDSFILGDFDCSNPCESVLPDSGWFPNIFTSTNNVSLQQGSQKFLMAIAHNTLGCPHSRWSTVPPNNWESKGYTGLVIRCSTCNRLDNKCSLVLFAWSKRPSSNDLNVSLTRSPIADNW